MEEVESRVQIISGPKRDETTRNWRELHSEDLHNLHSYQILVGRSKDSMMGRECSVHGGDQKHKEIVRKPKEQMQHGKPRQIWEDNIKMDLRKIGLQGVDWIHLAQDRD
jgi:hypothetical protein